MVSIKLTTIAKPTAMAIKIVCNHCRTLWIDVRPNGSLLFSQITEDNSGWMEVHVNASDAEVVVDPSSMPGSSSSHSTPSTSSQSISSKRLTIESKPLLAMMRNVTTLKDSLTFSFLADHVAISCGKAAGKDGSVAEKEETIDVPYLSEVARPLDSSPCSVQSCVAAVFHHATKDIELLVKDAMQAGQTHVAMSVPPKGGLGANGNTCIRFGLADEDGNHAQLSCVKEGCCLPVDGFSASFHGALLLDFLKNTLSTKVSLNLYDGLPLRIRYTWGSTRKPAAAKKLTKASSLTLSSGRSSPIPGSPSWPAEGREQESSFVVFLSSVLGKH